MSEPECTILAVLSQILAHQQKTGCWPSAVHVSSDIIKTVRGICGDDEGAYVFFDGEKVGQDALGVSQWFFDSSLLGLKMRIVS